MSTFALIHGAWGTGWHWGPLTAELERAGHRVVAPDLPCDDVEATFDDYAAVVLDALADAGDDVVVVGYSMGGHTATLVAARRPVKRLVYIGALLPEPGASLNDQLRRDRQLLPDYLAGLERDELGRSRWADIEVYRATTHHDCEDGVVRERFARSRPQARGAYAEPCSLVAQPALPTTYILCEEDGIMDNDYWRHAVPERLGVDPVVLAGSHSPMAARPAELALLLTAPG